MLFVPTCLRRRGVQRRTACLITQGQSTRAAMLPAHRVPAEMLRLTPYRDSRASPVKGRCSPLGARAGALRASC